MAHHLIEPIQALFEPLSGKDLVALFGDDEAVRALSERAAPLMEPDAEVIFAGAEAVALPGDLRGFDGMIAGWREWLTPFESYRFELEDLQEDGDRVVVLVRQMGRTLHGGVDVPSSPSAAVYTVRDGRITRAAFYLDRAHAADVEGFELPDS